MSVTRKFRFGAIPPMSATAQQWSSVALKIEDMGYSTLLLPDHFDDQFGPIAGLLGAALATSRLRVGTLVFDNDYRHPAVLAKELATLDLLTGGRLEFGLGAGWMAADYNQSGIPYDPIGTRIDRLEEAIAIFKGLFGDGPFSFNGRHYTIARLRGLPKPVQKPHPPLIIGGGGKRILSIAAREADIVNVNFVLRSGVYTTGADATGSAAATAEKVRWIQEAAAERMNAIELSVTAYFVAVTADWRQEAERLAPAFGLPPDEVLASPHVLLGSIDKIVDDLERRREEFGFSYIVFGEESFEAMGPVVSRLAGK